MTLILLEALLALLLLVGIVWWTMFSGRPKGELPQPTDEAPAQSKALTKAQSAADGKPTGPADSDQNPPKV